MLSSGPHRIVLISEDISLVTQMTNHLYFIVNASDIVTYNRFINTELNFQSSPSHFQAFIKILLILALSFSLLRVRCWDNV